jgi:glyoxylase-like metal-dependent hydrolase (beta-lactamase superfamily II)
MKIVSYDENLVQLTRFPQVFPMNCYLVRESDGFTLIDTAIAGSGKEILQAVSQLDMPITRIVLTHAHGDHAGSLDELHAALPGAEIIVPQRSVPFLKGNHTLHAGEPQTPVKGSWVVRQTQPNRTIIAGERVGSLEVIASPGHTPDHVSFFDTRNRALIAGDAFQTRAGIAVSGTLRPLFPFPALATWHKPSALASAKVLRGLDPSVLAVGHGAMLPHPLAAMDAAIAEAEKHFPTEKLVEQVQQHVV